VLRLWTCSAGSPRDLPGLQVSPVAMDNREALEWQDLMLSPLHRKRQRPSAHPLANRLRTGSPAHLDPPANPETTEPQDHRGLAAVVAVPEVSRLRVPEWVPELALEPLLPVDHLLPLHLIASAVSQRVSSNALP